jgi:hypothetical protein
MRSMVEGSHLPSARRSRRSSARVRCGEICRCQKCCCGGCFGRGRRVSSFVGNIRSGLMLRISPAWRHALRSRSMAKLISSVLIANRGEIARRIIRTARELGVRTIAVYSEADANAPFVMEADAAILIGPAPARESYLDPGEDPGGRQADGGRGDPPRLRLPVRERRLRPGGDRRRAGLDRPAALGDPRHGPEGRRQEADDRGRRAGDDPGLSGRGPVGRAPGQGGRRHRLSGADQGRGRRRRQGHAQGRQGGDFEPLASCQREASASFGDDRVLLEKYVTRPRHIEVQVFGDSHGNVVHLFERDCSLQRRHQKVIEEAPAPGMDEATRAAVCAAAVKAAQAVGYVGAGTVEFIADASEGLRADRIWFMEMNTRLQVEHPVTEMVTGQDLVEWQLRVASGEPCRWSRTRSRWTAGPWRRASMPRTRPPASCPRPAS